MFIIESDEIDKLYLPAHSNHRHNVHKQLRCICTQCYRGVTHQGQHVVIYARGGGITPGAKVLIEIFYILLYLKSFFKLKSVQMVKSVGFIP